MSSPLQKCAGLIHHSIIDKVTFLDGPCSYTDFRELVKGITGKEIVDIYYDLQKEKTLNEMGSN